MYFYFITEHVITKYHWKFYHNVCVCVCVCVCACVCVCVCVCVTHLASSLSTLSLRSLSMSWWNSMVASLTCETLREAPHELPSAVGLASMLEETLPVASWWWAIVSSFRTFIASLISSAGTGQFLRMPRSTTATAHPVWSRIG